MADPEIARKVLEIEAAAILALLPRLNADFRKAVEIIKGCRGRVIVTGVGKSGIIGRKIAATLASTGTPAFFLHSAEAIHGDLGAIQADDVMLAISNRGSTSEIVHLLKPIKRLGIPLIVLTGGKQSPLAEAADVTLDCSVTVEACPWNLVPTASTTAALALGDALAMTVSDAKAFKVEHFVSLHPGGKLGRIVTPVEQLMHAGEACPAVTPDTPMRDVIYEMSSKGLGMTCVVDDRRRLLGIITDGDLRRKMETAADILTLRAVDVMSRNPASIPPSTLVPQALELMENNRIGRRITALIVVEPETQQVAGVVHMHDLLRTEMV
jgi:arabinose-5-phosphate isomerase